MLVLEPDLTIIHITNPGDGHRPICQNCAKRSVQCERSNPDRKFVIYTTGPAPTRPERELNESQTSSDHAQTAVNHSQPDAAVVLSDRETSFQFPTPVSPTEDLRNELIASLYHHYIQHLAAWYDLCENERPFESMVPAKALEVSVLFNAIIAFSAQHKALSDARYETCSTLYHSACIQELLNGLSAFSPIMQEDYLVAACLLRSYEILNGIHHGA